MRTTLTLDNDVMEELKRLAAESDRAFKDVVNEALRCGLQNLQQPPSLPPYKTVPHHMGLERGISLNNVQELLSQVEGEDVR